MNELERCRGWIEAALEHANGTHDFWDIVKGIADGEMQLWPAAKGCLVTEIVIFPKRKVINVFIGGGELNELASMHEKITKWAKTQGCDGAVINGRRGWVRAFKKYGWNEGFTTVTKDFVQ